MWGIWLSRSLTAQVARTVDPVAEPLWRIVLREIPRDPGAIVVYLALAASIWLIWWANRRSGAGGGPEPGHGSDASPGGSGSGDGEPVTPGGGNGPRRGGARRVA